MKYPNIINEYINNNLKYINLVELTLETFNELVNSSLSDILGFFSNKY